MVSFPTECLVSSLPQFFHPGGGENSPLMVFDIGTTNSLLEGNGEEFLMGRDCVGHVPINATRSSSARFQVSRYLVRERTGQEEGEDESGPFPLECHTPVVMKETTAMRAWKVL